MTLKSGFSLGTWVCGMSLLFNLMGCVPQNEAPKGGSAAVVPHEALYSGIGTESAVEFRAIYKVHLKLPLSEWQIEEVREGIYQTLRFLYGPMTRRNWGAPQKGESVELLMSEARDEKGLLLIPYIYRGIWLLRSDLLDKTLNVPVPYADWMLRTNHWKTCTDNSDPGHSTWWFFWYFWDPARVGCEHREGGHYQVVTPKFGVRTQQTIESYPEYSRMVRNVNGRRVLQMTFAFGYVEDPAKPDPFRDLDWGMREFRSFHSVVEGFARAKNFRREPIRQQEYGIPGATVIGSSFEGEWGGFSYRIRVVASAGVDQMDLFAQSFAGDHEGFFGWFGHSRVGDGFDALRFERMLEAEPGRLSLTSDYQLVYWAGCNSYSYYTLPFFEMKAAMNRREDPRGTRNLDLLSNGLPSLFAFNAYNASVLFRALTDLDRPSSYQDLVNEIEGYANQRGYPVLVNVLGDEDNPK